MISQILKLTKNLTGLRLIVLASMSSMAAGSENLIQTTDDVIPFKTSYEVPVDDQSLAPFARFEMPATVKKNATGQWEFCYRLPWQVTSKSTAVPVIEFKTTKQIDANTYEVRGAHTDGTCTFGEKKSSCHLFYGNLNIDENVTKAELAKEFSGPELDMRSAVAEKFARGPEGILLFEAP